MRPFSPSDPIGPRQDPAGPPDRPGDPFGPPGDPARFGPPADLAGRFGPPGGPDGSFGRSGEAAAGRSGSGRVPWAGAGRRWLRPAALVTLLVVGVGALLVARSVTTPGPAPVEQTGRPAASANTQRAGHGPPMETADQPSAGSPGPASGYFVEATGGSPVVGTQGSLRRYRVVVEAGTDQDPVAFAATVDATLGDPRSWIASGELRVQRVSGAEPADFTVYLATATTSERMCAEGGLLTAGYASCRLPGQVVINLDRWLTAVPDYAAPLDVYRAYVINHEVGHEFGQLHEACPGPGRPAPVMQQQTYGLAGCVANAWPYLDGRRYAGDLVP